MRHPVQIDPATGVAGRPPGVIEEELRPDAGQVRAPKLLRLINLWHAARDGGAGLPRKSRIDAVDLGGAGLLAQIWLVERQPDRRLVYRLAGEEINAVFGRSIAGLTLDDLIEPEDAAVVSRRWHRLLDDGLVLHAIGDVYSDAGRLFSGERVVLPLTDDDGLPCFLIGVTDYRLIDPGERAGPQARIGVPGARRGFIPVGRITRMPVDDGPETAR